MRGPATLRRRLHLPPPWTALLGLAAGLAVVAWRGVSGHGEPLIDVIIHSLVWPGAAVAVAVYGFAWLGWALDID